jgi:hypothetical protein
MGRLCEARVREGYGNRDRNETEKSFDTFAAPGPNPASLWCHLCGNTQQKVVTPCNRKEKRKEEGREKQTNKHPKPLNRSVEPMQLQEAWNCLLIEVHASPSGLMKKTAK